MNDQAYKDLVRNVWHLYKLASETLKKINQTFFDDLVNLDLEEENRRIQGEEMPY
jgi:hypothetical protein